MCIQMLPPCLGRSTYSYVAHTDVIGDVNSTVSSWFDPSPRLLAVKKAGDITDCLKSRCLCPKDPES